MTDTPPAKFDLRPMSIGDILDTAFRLYRQQFVPFLTISLIVYVPYIILLLVLGLAVSSEPRVVHTIYGDQVEPDMGGTLVNLAAAVLFFLILWPLVQGAMTYHISAGFLGERISAGESYRRAGGRLPGLLGTQFLVGLVVILGMCLLVVPGIIFSLWFAIIAPVVLLEKLSGRRAMSRSRELMKGNLGKAFSLGFVVGILNMIVMAVTGFVLGRLGLNSPTWVGLGTNLVQALILPILVAPTILLYYDLRIRKEAFDLEAALRGDDGGGGTGGAVMTATLFAIAWGSAAIGNLPLAAGVSPLRLERTAEYHARARAVVEQVLAASEFGGSERSPSLWRRLWNWCIGLFDRIGRTAHGLPGWLFWVVLIWLVLALVAILAHLVYVITGLFGARVGGQRAGGPNAVRGPGELFGLRDLEPEEAYQQAVRLLAQCDWPQATRYLYVAAILWLDRAGCIHFHQAKTNQDYVKELMQHPRYQAGFRELTRWFESVVYGQRPATGATCQEMMVTLDSLRPDGAIAKD